MTGQQHSRRNSEHLTSVQNERLFPSRFGSAEAGPFQSFGSLGGVLRHIGLSLRSDDYNYPIRNQKQSPAKRYCTSRETCVSRPISAQNSEPLRLNLLKASSLGLCQIRFLLSNCIICHLVLWHSTTPGRETDPKAIGKSDGSRTFDTPSPSLRCGGRAGSTTDGKDAPSSVSYGGAGGATTSHDRLDDSHAPRSIPSFGG